MAEFTKKQLQNILYSLSIERLDRYAPLARSKDAGKTLLPYLSMQVVLSAFYPTVQIVEICMRNRIHLAMTEFYTGRSRNVALPGAPDKWYEWMPTETKTVSNIHEAKSSAKKKIQGRKVIPGDIISRLSFGTWASILQERPCNTDPLYFWTGIEKTVFPHASLNKKQKLQEIRWANDLRNRLFHHEPIWTENKATGLDTADVLLKKKHKRLLDILNWMSEDLYKAYALDFGYDAYFQTRLEEAIKTCKSAADSRDLLCKITTGK